MLMATMVSLCLAQSCHLPRLFRYKNHSEKWRKVRTLSSSFPLRGHRVSEAGWCVPLTPVQVRQSQGREFNLSLELHSEKA